MSLIFSETPIFSKIKALENISKNYEIYFKEIPFIVFFFYLKKNIYI